MPATSGCTSRSNVSRPRRRRAKLARLSSAPLSRRGTKYSQASLSLPSGLRIGVVTTGQIRLGAISMKPSGIGTSRPRRTTNAFLPRGFVPISSSPRPSRRQRSTAQGTFVMKLSAPCSTRKPSRRWVQSDPPKRSLASNSVSSIAGSSSMSRCAAARPAIPPPITAIRRRGEVPDIDR